MMQYIKTSNSDIITPLRTKLYQNLTAPIDAMWEQLYIASAQDYLIKHNETSIGYCCINEDKSLLQLYLEKEFRFKMDSVISELIEANLIESASLSSNEPVSFNACLVLSKSKIVNTICFEHINTMMNVDSELKIKLVTNDIIPKIKAFYLEQVGMNDTFGYTENLVSRKELFWVQESSKIIATTELRISETQPEFADLGIIVHKEHHGKGIATQVLKKQVNRVLELGRKPICSTTIDNIASRKAIEKAGFYCSNIIFDMKF